MNNGQPPYGDPSQWGQQPVQGQNPSAQYDPAQPYSGQYPVQNGYQQVYGQQSYQPQTYQPQAHQAQESYQQQSWQPYGHAQDYGQQGYGQQAYSQQPYQNPYQQGYQQNAYQQTMQNAQPLQGYGQTMQNPQEPVPGQFYPAQGYSGYVSQPKGKKPEISLEIIAKVVLYGVLPVLFILAIWLKLPALCWIFVIASALSVAALWVKELVAPNLRLTASLVYGVLAVVALVVAFNGAPVKDGQTQQNGTASVPGANAAQQGGDLSTGMTWEATPTPTLSATATPAPIETSEAEERLYSFFFFWHMKDEDDMLALTAPSWRAMYEDPAYELWRIRANRSPQDDCEIVHISGTDADAMRTAKVKVSIDKNINRAPERYSFNVLLLKEDGAWYIDPRSLESNEKETPTKAAANVTPTQPVRMPGQPTTELYYNTKGGSYYHLKADCGEIAPRYYPYIEKFYFSQINDPPYNELQYCQACGAPRREN